MVSDIEFRAYRPEDKEPIISLLATGQHESYSRQKATVFDWQFFGNPASDGVPFLIGTVGDTIVATIGFMPVKVRFRGKAATGCWCVDMYVSASHRGRGFGKALVARVAERATVMLALGISHMSDAIFDTQGWPRDRSMATMFCHLEELGVKGLAKNLLTSGARLIGGWRRSGGAPPTVEPAVEGAQLDALWSRVEGQYVNVALRNGAYLTWRYRDSPTLTYRWVAARSGGELQGLLITRHHTVESVIVDYLGPLDDPTLLVGLCAGAVANLASAGTRRVRCETTHPALKAALLAVGFIPNGRSGGFRTRSNVSPPSTSTSNWFVMTGDSDNDLFTW